MTAVLYDKPSISAISPSIDDPRHTRLKNSNTSPPSAVVDIPLTVDNLHSQKPPKASTIIENCFTNPRHFILPMNTKSVKQFYNAVIIVLIDLAFNLLNT
jgi:hypothetical protein